MILSSRSKRCLLIGSTGFVGSEIGLALEREGFEIYRFLRGPVSGLEPPAFYGDSNGDFSMRSLVAFMRSNRISSVVHCGNVFSRQQSPEIADQMLFANFFVPAKVLVAAVDSGVEMFINLASAWQLDSGRLAEAPVYVSTKEAFRNFLSNYSNRIRTVTIFLNEVFGCFDSRDKIINQAIRAAISGEEFQVRSAGRELGLTNVKLLASEVSLILRGLGSWPAEFLYENYSAVTIANLMDTIGELSETFRWTATSDETISATVVTLDTFGETSISQLQSDLAELLEAQRNPDTRAPG